MSDPKEQTKMWKLYMSSLFARSMPYLVTGFLNNDWLFTDIRPIEIQNSTVSSDGVCQFVHFKKPAIQQILFDAFPLLKEASVIVNITTISKAINSFGIEMLKLVLENKRVVRLVVAGKDDHSQLSDLPCVGMLLSQYELNYYINYKDRFIDRKQYGQYTIVISKVATDELVEPKGSVNCVNVKSCIPGTTEWRWFRIPMLDGKNYPSMFEYGKKSGLESFIFNAEILWRQRSVEAVLAYDDDNISVRSVCPRRLWYPVLIS